jgi:chromate transporter
MAGLPTTSDARTASARVPLHQIFLEFLLIGATSFGGGVIAYLRSSLVAKRGWLDDKKFVELLSISQSLPGLNATNMAVLVGDRLRGLTGAIAALIGICLPGGVLMFIAASIYSSQADRPLAGAALKGVAAAAVGLILATTAQLGRKALPHRYDLVFVALAVVGVNFLKLSVLTVLLVVGALAIMWYRPGSRASRSAATPEPNEENVE